MIAANGPLKRKLSFTIVKTKGNLEGYGFKHYKDRMERVSEKKEEEED